MTEARPRPGKHAARHRAPTAFERTRNRTLDSLAALGDVSPPRVANGGRALAVTAVGGALVASAVVGTQVARDGGPEVATASADTDSDMKAGSADSDAANASAERDGSTVSRSAARPTLDEAKKQATSAAPKSAKQRPTAKIVTKKAEVDASELDPREIAKEMLSDYGWGEEQFSCLDELWIGESDWKVNADNPTSSAYGIPQALPGSKMASAGSDWETNPATQIEWGLGYIKDHYGSPCEAQSFKSGNNWY